MKAGTNVIQDGQFYQKGDEVPELGSWVAVEVQGSVRHYKGLDADVPRLPRYAGTGSTAECLDTGKVYKYEKSTGKWYPSGTGGGGGSGGGSTSYEFTQDVPQKEWTIAHGLGRQYPDVLCIDGSGNTVYGDIDYHSGNVTIVRFGSAITGKAIVR